MSVGLSAKKAQIVDARARVLRAPVHEDIAMSFAALTHRSMVLVELELASGLIGYGESWVNHPPWAHIERVATLEQGVFPLVLGEDARRITYIQRKLVAALDPIGRQWGARGPIMQAISGVDTALWDLRGKANDQAISWLGGGRRIREHISVYASGLGPKHVGDQSTDCVARGHTAVKIRLGFGRDRDASILEEVRRACGREITIYVDANQAWELEEAVAIAPLLKTHGVAWVEEPVRGNRLADLEALHQRTGLTIATGENIYGREGFWSYAASPSVAILQPDLSKTGGLTETLAVCELALANATDVIPHLYGGAVAFAATLQLAGLSPAISSIEYDVRHNPLRDPLLIDPPDPLNGRITIPDAPGLGVTLDTAAMDHYAI